MTEDAHEFTIQVNGGTERMITVASPFYQDAAAAVPALMGVALPCTVRVTAAGQAYQYELRYEDAKFCCDGCLIHASTEAFRRCS